MSVKNLQRSYRVNIAGIDISVKSKSKDLVLRIPPVYFPFFISDESGVKISEPEVKIEVCRGSVPGYQRAETIFETGTTWTLYRYREKRIIETPSIEMRSRRSQIAVFESDFQKGKIYIPEAQRRRSSRMQDSRRSQIANVFKNPFGEVLMVNLLALGRGAMIHSCAVSYQGEGLLFAGESGAGKSTMAHLWETRKGAVILNDDRVIIRKESETFRAYGTPWHGTAMTCSPQSIPLKKIFFLKKAKSNAARMLHPSEAVSRLIASSFPPYWDKEGMMFTLDFCAQLSSHIPCYELDFLPDESILDYILNEK